MHQWVILSTKDNAVELYKQCAFGIDLKKILPGLLKSRSYEGKPDLKFSQYINKPSRNTKNFTRVFDVPVPRLTCKCALVHMLVCWHKYYRHIFLIQRKNWLKDLCRYLYILFSFFCRNKRFASQQKHFNLMRITHILMCVLFIWTSNIRLSWN